jgi:periplasmic protein CpxP/Spy
VRQYAGHAAAPPFLARATQRPREKGVHAMTQDAQPQTGWSHRPTGHRHGNGRRAVMLGLVVLAIGAAAYVGAAYGQMRDGFGRWDGMGGAHAMMHRDGNSQHAMAVDFILYRLNASPAQRRQVEAIAQQARADLNEFHLGLPALLETFAEEVAKPALDRPALEVLRARHLALADLASLRLTEAVADAVEVLTPEQRVQLAADLKKMPRRHR